MRVYMRVYMRLYMRVHESVYESVHESVHVCNFKGKFICMNDHKKSKKVLFVVVNPELF